ncbi:MAG: hypothetical protein H6Q68_2281 [Firmicutes bacterium]|nr:hypothetical protein [Bacillota bacterium]
MGKVNGEEMKDSPKTDKSSDCNKELGKLSNKELENVSGGVPGYWDYDDPTTHS